MKNRITKYAPAGIDLKMERKVFLVGILCALGYSMFFLLRFKNAYDELFEWSGTRKFLIPGAVMPDFVELLDSAMWGFLILHWCMLLLILYHYAYHRQGSKSIYLMKRIPDRWELHRRCLTIPIILACVSLIAMGIIFFLYYKIYMTVTPVECMQPNQWQKIWSVIL